MYVAKPQITRFLRKKYPSTKIEYNNLREIEKNVEQGD